MIAGEKPLRLATFRRSERTFTLYVWRLGRKSTGPFPCPNRPCVFAVSFFQAFHLRLSTR